MLNSKWEGNSFYNIRLLQYRGRPEHEEQGKDRNIKYTVNEDWGCKLDDQAQ